MQNIKVAVVGAGPAGFYAVEELLKYSDAEIQVDLYERLPAPYGLVRYGVAPDHLKIKNVTAIYDKIAEHPRFCYYGNVELGKQLTLQQLQDYYHGVILTTGASDDRKLAIAGEDLPESYPATAFVGWYNGHPDYRDLQFNLNAKRAVVIGVGNVAIDVARILVSTPEELRQSDIAEHALEALSHSQIEEVVIVGRRGPAQAAFTNPELKELEELQDADFWAMADEVNLDVHSAAALQAEPDKAVTKRLDLLKGAAQRHGQRTKSKLLTMRFCWSPTELVEENGHLVAVRLQKNEITSSLQAKGIDQHETISAGLVFRSVGYRGLPIAGVPFNEKKGTIDNEGGRVKGMPGLYAAGWIKRGPSGVIGTNKPCAKESVALLLEDLKAGVLVAPKTQAHPSTLLGDNPVIDYAAWKVIDQLEKSRGTATGRPRLKLTTVDEMVQAAATANV